MVKTILAVIPFIWLLFGLSKLKLSMHKVTVFGLTLTAAIALQSFSMPWTYLLQAAAEGFILALFPIIWVVLSALFVYMVTAASGGMDQIKKMLSSISPDRRIQGLILAFSFGGFLESVAGFGTAVAIPAGILMAMGFNPIMATVLCLMSNTIPVAFGVLGVPIITLSQVTSLPLDKLTFYTAIQLIPFVVILPIIISALITRSWKDLEGIICISLLSGLVFATGQTLTAVYIGPELAAVIGSLSSLIFFIIWLKFFPVKKPWRFKEETSEKSEHHEVFTFDQVLKAWSPYLLILILIIPIKLINLFEFFNKYPFTLEQQFFYGEGGKQMLFPIATSGGTLLFISAICGGFIQGLSFKKIFVVFTDTLKQIWKSALTILSIMALAKIMVYSSMIKEISIIFTSAGMLFPFISPMLGAFGTFLTGSDTSSNVLFGNLQKQTALNLQLNYEWITAANASGATAGKMISPQSISIATSSVGLAGEDWNILRRMLGYCLGYVIVMGVLVFAVQKLFFI